jgi:phospho-N-acetylmuramoyl-pentapeptide-transferase
VQSILLAIALGVALTGLGTPPYIDLLVRLGIGSQERVDGVRAHLAKQGTPTMGGGIVVAAATVSYVLAHVTYGNERFAVRRPSAAGLIGLCAMWALGSIGAVDDLISATRRRSLGLSPAAKTAGQAVASVALAVAAVRWAHVPSEISWAGRALPTLPTVAVPIFVVWVFVIVWVFSNGVNIVDGTDGLASGSGAFALFVYVLICFWEFRHATVYGTATARGLHDAAVVTAALLGATIGFLWWNAPPARVILGDAGAMAIGGVLASTAIVTKTQLLLPVIGGLFVADYASSLVQIAFFKLTRRYWPSPSGGGRRLFAMAPVHHHFELKGWPEFTVTIRFWLVAGVLGGLGLALFYMHFLTISPIK